MERSKTLVKNMEINQRNFRKEHLAIRNAMLPGEVAEKSSAIVKRLLQSEWYKDAKEIFAYYPLGNEVDCHALFLQAWADGKRIALPRTKEENQMDFFYIDSLKQLEEGTFHVMDRSGAVKKQIRYSNQSLFREVYLAGTAAVMGMERVIMTAFLQNTQD